MSDIRSPWDPDPAVEPDPRPAVPPARTGEEPVADVEPLRLRPLLASRQNPWLIVEVDGSAAGHGALVWALREAARREATVVAVHVLDDHEGDPLGGSARVHVRTRSDAQDRLEAHVLRAIAETGVQDRCRTAVLDRPVFDALSAATQGADLVVVGSRGKSLLRHAIPRPLSRRLARGA
jgi:nucleotide-binding universal stress UspA family protein